MGRIRQRFRVTKKIASADVTLARDTTLGREGEVEEERRRGGRRTAATAAGGGAAAGWRGGGKGGARLGHVVWAAWNLCALRQPLPTYIKEGVRNLLGAIPSPCWTPHERE